MRQSGKQFGIPCPLHHGWAWLKQDNRFYQLHVSIAQCLGQPRGTLEPAARQQHPWSSWMHYIWQIMFRMHCSEQKPKQYTICMHTSDKKMFYLLSPISRIADAGGPMNLSPCLSQSCAKSALSERKPYPGWIACTKQIGGKMTQKYSWLHHGTISSNFIAVPLSHYFPTTLFLYLHGNVM